MTLDRYAFIFGCAYAEACGKDPGDDYALMGQADRAGLKAVIEAVLDDVAKHFEAMPIQALYSGVAAAQAVRSCKSFAARDAELPPDTDVRYYDDGEPL